MRVDERDRRDGGDRGRCVTFLSPRDPQTCVLTCKSAAPLHSSDNRNDGGNPGNNLHVSGLSLRVEERDLEDLFGKHGRVRLVSVLPPQPGLLD